MMQGWNLYHKSVVAALSALVFSVFLKLIVSIEGGQLLVSKEIYIQKSAQEVWPYLHQNALRKKWEAHLLDASKLMGDSTEPGSRRFLFWRNENKKRWSGVEETYEVLPYAKFSVLRQSDRMDRKFDMEIIAIDAENSKVILTEYTDFTNYIDRFWSFTMKEAFSNRLELSLEALKSWLENNGIRQEKSG